MKKKVISLLLASAMVLSMAACGSEDEPSNSSSGSESVEGSESTPAESSSGSDEGEADVPPAASGTVTYRTYTSVMPSNWNGLTYEDANDAQIMDWLGSSFFTYDFKFEDGKKFNDDGSINAEGIVPGEFDVMYSAATKLEDVTSEVDAKWGYTDEQKEMGSYAWKITLREDLKWEDGTAIDAHDFVYTMQQQLDPLFQNMRASTFYNNIMVKGARDYVYQGQTVWSDNGATGEPGVTVADLVKGDDGVYAMADGTVVRFALTQALKQCSNYSVTDIAADYLDPDAFAALQELADGDGRVPVTDDTIALVAKLIDTDGWGHEPVENVPLYMVLETTYESTYSDVL